jgi:prefoldin subunit 5
MSKSWVTAAESVKVAWTDAAAGLGEKIAAGINLNAILTGIADKIRDQPEIATAIGGAVGLAVTGGLGLAATRAFMAPAGALSGAAAELSAAAAVLSGGAGIPDVPGSGKGKANVWDKVAAVAATVATVGASVTAGLAVPAATSYLESPLSETGKAFEAANQSALSLAYAQLDLHNKTQRLADLEAQRIAPKAETPFDKFQPTYPEQVETEKQSLRTEIERLTNAIAQWQSGTPWEQAVKALQQQPVEQKQPNWVAGAIAEIRKAQLPPDWKPSEQTKPEMKWPDPTVISSASDVMRAAMEAGGTQIQGAANTLSNTTGTFSAVFATGAQAIGSSGQMAASTLQGAAPGIGQSIGAAAAAAIQAAVANLNVNVNANVVGGGSDKGSIKEVGK